MVGFGQTHRWHAMGRHKTNIGYYVDVKINVWRKSAKRPEKHKTDSNYTPTIWEVKSFRWCHLRYQKKHSQQMEYGMCEGYRKLYSNKHIYLTRNIALVSAVLFQKFSASFVVAVAVSVAQFFVFLLFCLLNFASFFFCCRHTAPLTNQIDFVASLICNACNKPFIFSKNWLNFGY